MHLLFAILAVWRLTELATADRISAPIRKRWPWYIWTCQRCVSVWAGIVCTIAYVYFPWFNWPLGLSGIFLVYQFTLSKVQSGPAIQGKGLIIDVDASGNMKLLRSDLDAKDLARVGAGLTTLSNNSKGRVPA